MINFKFMFDGMEFIINHFLTMVRFFSWIRCGYNRTREMKNSFMQCFEQNTENNTTQSVILAKISHSVW